MWRFERRWARAVLEAFAPPETEGLSPAPGEVDYAGAFARMMATSTRKAALGTRLALWIAAWAPVWMGMGLRPISRVGIDVRADIVRRLASHRIGLIQELTMLLKLGASFALLGTDSVRARSGYDRGVDPKWSETGEDASELRRRLPLAKTRPGTSDHQEAS